MGEKVMEVMDGMEGKIDGTVVKVDDAVKIASEAKSEVQLVEAKVAVVQGEVDSMRKEIKDMEKNTGGPMKEETESEVKLRGRIGKIEEEIAKMTVAEHNNPETIVLGGLQGASSLEEAEELVNKTLKAEGLPPIMNTY